MAAGFRGCKGRGCLALRVPTAADSWRLRGPTAAGKAAAGLRRTGACNRLDNRPEVSQNLRPERLGQCREHPGQLGQSLCQDHPGHLGKLLGKGRDKWGQ